MLCVPSQKTEDFLYALGKVLEFYGGVPRIIVPDNLKAAVTKADKYEPVLNNAMDDMGNHYGFVTIPCQLVKPTQKAKVENPVKIICHNRTRMQQRPYTREERFHAVEKPGLRPLPETPYQMKRYAEVIVQQNRHVYLSCDKHYYSVPYTLIGCKARIIFTSTLVKVYVKGGSGDSLVGPQLRLYVHRGASGLQYPCFHETLRDILQREGESRLRYAPLAVRRDVRLHQRLLSARILLQNL